MKHLTMCVLAFAALGAEARAADVDGAIAAPIHQFIDSFDKGDAKAAAAANWADLAITDEVPPFAWRGPGTFAGWSGDLASYDAKHGLTGEKVVLGEITRTEIDGDLAYVVVPAVYTFKEHGAPMREAAQMTFALRKGPGGWRISAWTWTGPRAQAAGR